MQTRLGVAEAVPHRMTQTSTRTGKSKTAAKDKTPQEKQGQQEGERREVGHHYVLRGHRRENL